MATGDIDIDGIDDLMGITWVPAAKSNVKRLKYIGCTMNTRWE